METMRMLTSLSNCGLSGAHLPERNSSEADLCGTHPEHICVKRYRHSICLHSGRLPRMTKKYSSSEYSASAAYARFKQQKIEHSFRSALGIRRRPTLPGRVQPSTIGAEGLNFCVRYGNRWNPFAIATGNCIILLRTLTIAHFVEKTASFQPFS